MGLRVGADRVRAWRALAALAAVLLAAGCATIPPDAGRDPRDPWERYNRHMADINDRVDRAVTKPLATAYSDYVPQGARDCVNGVFSNLYDVPNALNNLLQGKPAAAVNDVCRVLVNSTVGLLGCFDVASRVGLQKNDEDFGQTLGRWGSGDGPYFVLPLLGPSSVRDATGRVVGFYTDPLSLIDDVPLRNTLAGVRFVDLRAGLLPAERVLEGAALDRYRFVRDAYLQLRRNQVYDGNPPRPKDEDPEDMEDPEPPAKPAAAGPPRADTPDQPAGGAGR